MSGLGRERATLATSGPEAPRRSFTPEETAGLLFGTGAFLIWGLTPLYFKSLGALPVEEIVSHRFVWCVAFLIIVLTASRQWLAVVRTIREPRVVGVLLVTALLIGGNWGVFIHAVLIDRIVASSLGYFLNPLVSVFLGFVFLRERLSALQWTAVALAAAGVGVQIVAYGSLPWISLVLALSFAIYGLLRKTVAAGAAVGLFVEALLLSPLALGVLVWLDIRGLGAFGHHGLGFDALLAFAGLATGLPLLLFAAGARRVKLSTMGLLQYLAPTGNLLIAVAVYDEPFGPVELLTFSLIWAALVLYTIEIWRTRIV